MNNPILLTSAVILLAGVAARPINPERGDELSEMRRTPSSNDDSQAVLGRMPSQGSFDSANSLQLHDFHDTVGVHSSSEELAGSASPRMKGTVPDPGLSSPYITAQRYLSTFGDKDLETPVLSPINLDETLPSTPSKSKPGQNETTPPPYEAPEYSPVVVALVISSAASLVLLGLAIAVVYVSHVVRHTLLGGNMWSAVSRGGKWKGQGLQTSEKENLGGREAKMIEEGGLNSTNEKALIAAREVPTELRSSHPAMESKEVTQPEAVDDPDDMALPEASVPAMREKANDRRLAASFVAWTYDNWVTHFMFALFGWVGALLSGGRGQ
ncbi:hypothetical protein M422DRAFT_52390 [Sphaerobolus stellatus SS14]|uniref:Autophagy-related protein 27 n=1 Tax=Sphaerobolus stellatus (strain SS14) TaxID=990650 RepID=A0A0C9V7Z8_SPHS4|nr:hypothetical protein M422DRAFT_52390 [Sphaerobolus stellatus SS14]